MSSLLFLSSVLLGIKLCCFQLWYCIFQVPLFGVYSCSKNMHMLLVSVWDFFCCNETLFLWLLFLVAVHSLAGRISWQIVTPVVGSIIVFVNSWKVDPLTFFTCVLLSAAVCWKFSITMSACAAFSLCLMR